MRDQNTRKSKAAAETEAAADLAAVRTAFLRHLEAQQHGAGFAEPRHAAPTREKDKGRTRNKR